eukprot:CAMPEP_0185724056 /NCGR_PEP_ID=MMETSP1171-20130828/660_1 /TAXON_ID=374046 /ORGANISM="Helicotheca tamensis, Strain CCMP826" /LENGTH=272 /DNA_ID=CAMNT_0028391831 /DNA_START=178 /DNA_END=996 /DNA_ORIENTATION=+
MRISRTNNGVTIAALIVCLSVEVMSFHSPFIRRTSSSTNRASLAMSQGSGTAVATSFIDTELRGAAMKLHTKKQAPKEGQAPEKQPPTPKPYTPTHADYLSFLVDSQHVYQTMEDIVNQKDELSIFRNTGLERTKPLEADIQFMCEAYGLQRPDVGQAGLSYVQELQRIASGGSDLVPEFLCHYYNFYFAHTAGGRMIGKQMSALLLDKKTLDFYKWDGDLNKIKANVKESIEDMAAKWTQEEKDVCVSATAAAFRGGGALNSYLSGGHSPH